MDSLTIIEIAAWPLLLLVSAFFSGSETVFFSLDPLALRLLTARSPAVGARVHAILNQPTRLLSTILIGNTIVGVALAALCFAVAEKLLPILG